MRVSKDDIRELKKLGVDVAELVRKALRDAVQKIK